MGQKVECEVPVLAFVGILEMRVSAGGGGDVVVVDRAVTNHS